MSDTLLTTDADILFAQFWNGKLRLITKPIQGTEFFAISHVWGADATWSSLACHENEVFLSAHKAKFIDERLENLVGETPFWMDVICINQRSQAAVIGVTKVIPTIFRKAKKTIAIRDGDGFSSCCAEALGNGSTWTEISQNFAAHLDVHVDRPFEESFLARLWTLQECSYSRAIQFVSCRNGAIPEREGHSEIYSYFTKPLIALDRLYTLAMNFEPLENDPADSGVRRIVDFVHAYVNLGVIRKDGDTDTFSPSNIYAGAIWWVNNGSARVASTSRDYILATMTQFHWYQPPHLVRTMDFSKLFTDLCQQAKAADQRLIARFTSSMMDPIASMSERWSPSPQQPEPRSLGDFLKLFGNEPKNSSDGYVYHLAQQVRLGPTSILDRRQSLEIIESAMKFSRIVWYVSHSGGELALHGSYPAGAPVHERELLRLLQDRPDDPEVAVLQQMVEEEYMRRSSHEFVLSNSRAILDAMWCASNTQGVMVRDWKYFCIKELPQQWSGQMQDALLLMAAMVSCRVPLSAIAWAHTHFQPVTITTSTTILLGLLSRHAAAEAALHSDVGQAMLLGARHSSGRGQGTDLVLVDTATRMPVGLAPDFLQIPRTPDQYEKGIRDLYGGLALQVDGERASIIIVGVDVPEPASVPGFEAVHRTRRPGNT